MHHDDLAWEFLGKSFCSYRYVSQKNKFCRHECNVTGLCNQVSCPLSNGNYGTVIEKDGVCYLYLKTVERIHSPNKTWEKIKLSTSYKEALEQIDTHMKNIYKDHQIHRCKLRFTRLRQVFLHIRHLKRTSQGTLVPIKKKTERRERARELKAQTAAKLEHTIEDKLLERLRIGLYGSLYDKEIPEEAAEELSDEDYDEKSAVDFENIAEITYDLEDLSIKHSEGPILQRPKAQPIDFKSNKPVKVEYSVKPVKYQSQPKPPKILIEYENDQLPPNVLA